MNILDSHVHMRSGGLGLTAFLDRLSAASVEKALLISCHPESFGLSGEISAPKERLNLLMDWASASPRIAPFYWIDPLEIDACDQVDAAILAGVAGFKCICNRHYPGDDIPMRIWHKIARAGKPILFHSGILYSKTPSSIYNRPAGFEPLFDVPNLRFALAHVSWPWHDECLAVYGKWSHNRASGLTSAEMFIDTTPGTPPIYREEVLTKLYTIGYDIENNVMFGVDNSSDYDAQYAQKWIDIDSRTHEKLGSTTAQIDKYFYANALRFIVPNR